MKFKNIRIPFLAVLVLGVLFMLNSCTNDDSFTFGEDMNTVDFTEFGVDFDTKGALIATSDFTGGFFNLVDKDNTEIGFTVDDFGEEVNSVDMYLSYNGGSAASMGSISSFPTTVTSKLTDAVATLGLDIDALSPGDVFTFSFDNVSTGTGTYKSGTMVNVDASCPSELAGEYTGSTTVVSTGAGIFWDGCAGQTWSGAVHIVEEAPGVYTFATEGPGGEMWTDASIGAFYACYGTTNEGSLAGGDLTFGDICGTLSWSGVSQWVEVYSFTKVDVNGNELTIGWENDYGEAGETVITNPNGDWPSGLTF